MIKMLELREMIRLVSENSIQEFSLKNNGVRITMIKQISKISGFTEETVQTAFNEAANTLEQAPQNSARVVPNIEDEGFEVALHQIVSPVIGVFASSAGRGGQPYVTVGDHTTKGTIIGHCKVEKLDLDQEIISDVEGEVVEFLVEDGEVVEYGQPLFLVKLKS
ncbi:acetyl-CoA carboxylase biotin carboxyl carrier protein [Neobacillus niacini]|uniref:biotin/lipoyl-containing protein n=1 Tax=Neobacillus niacini TaxID=86668 RepID=UPI00278AF1AD|nr:biotin/lipoyl-containing protein [Neobacillus niacini]MDQ1005370.1 acetyl-CoA carboxylase biotin carboxyl carrier protein [Neobacillus niacini]